MLKVQTLDEIVDSTERTVGADTIIKVFGPMIEQRIETLLRSIIAAQPDELLELRGSLKEVYRILIELRQLAAHRQTADVAFDNMFKQTNHGKGVTQHG